MTLDGFTALSLEMSTTRQPRIAPRPAHEPRAPDVFLTASAGLRSMSGTCLCAAAWKIHPAWPSEDRVDPRGVGDVRDQRIGPEARMARVEVSRDVEEGFSYCSTRSRRDGPKPASCRTSSLPMDPPHGDEHRASVDEPPHRFGVQMDRRPAHEVGWRQVPNLADLDFPSSTSADSAVS